MSCACTDALGPDSRRRCAGTSRRAGRRGTAVVLGRDRTRRGSRNDPAAISDSSDRGGSPCRLQCSKQTHSLSSRTTWVSRQKKDKTILDFNEARDDGVAVASAGPQQIICTLLQTDNHAITSTLNSFTGWILFLMPNQQCQSTEGNSLQCIRLLVIEFVHQQCNSNESIRKTVCTVTTTTTTVSRDTFSEHLETFLFVAY